MCRHWCHSKYNKAYTDCYIYMALQYMMATQYKIALHLMSIAHHKVAVHNTVTFRCQTTARNTTPTLPIADRRYLAHLHMAVWNTNNRQWPAKGRRTVMLPATPDENT